jgi:glycine hydroxymethyltransferase
MASLLDTVLDAARSYEHELEDCLILNAARNILSPRARALLGGPIADGDWAGRLHADEATYSAAALARLEKTTRDLIERLFSKQHAELRSPTGSVANGLAAVALTECGSEILVPPAWAYGHKSLGAGGYPGYAGRRITEMPWNARLMQPDMDRLRTLVHGGRPSLIVLGTSRPLFHDPLADVAVIAREGGARMLYDGAHLLGLIAAGAFPNPLQFGFDALTGSTHKTLPGPLGGLIVCAEAAVHETVAGVADQWLASYSASRIAALAYVLAEIVTVGPAYGARIVENARALGGSLANRGFRVIGAERGFTQTHQILVDVTDTPNPQDTARRLAQAGVLVNGPECADRRVRNMREDGLWLRLGTSVMTRLAMGPPEMGEIAAILHRVLLSSADPALMRPAVADLLRRHRVVAFTL